MPLLLQVISYILGISLLTSYYNTTKITETHFATPYIKLAI